MKRLRAWWQRVSRGWADEDWASINEKLTSPRNVGDRIGVSASEKTALLHNDPIAFLILQQSDKR